MVIFSLEKLNTQTKITMILAIDTELYFHDCNLFYDKVLKKNAIRISVPWILKQSHCKMTEETIERGCTADH